MSQKQTDLSCAGWFLFVPLRVALQYPLCLNKNKTPEKGPGKCHAHYTLHGMLDSECQGKTILGVLTLQLSQLLKDLQKYSGNPA